MKLTVMLLTLFLVQASARISGQQVSYSVKQGDLKTAFASLKKQTGMVFFYSPEDIAKAKAVSVDFKNIAIEKALEALLKDQPLGYTIQGNTIFIAQKKSEPTKNESAEATSPPPLTVHGRITNENGEPVVGVTISIKGGKAIGATDEKGEFTISVTDGNATLVFSAVTIETFEVKLNGRTELGLKAKIKVSQLEDVVINKGYYSVKQRENTGNVSKVTAKEIEQQPVSNVLAALEGRVPGLVIKQSTGLPGSGFTVQIRGQNSIINGNTPFVVVDGVPYNSSIPGYSSPTNPGLINGSLSGGSPLNYINPSDIESVEVLKDADATAIYGSQAANGAILITTKKAKPGTMRVSINASTGLSDPARNLKVLNLQQYLAIRHEAFRNDGITTIPASNYDLAFWDTTRSTDWGKVFIYNRAVYTNAAISVSGGTANTQYLISGGFNRQTSGMPKMVDNTGADQIGTVHLNITNLSPDKRFKLSLDANYSSDVNTVGSADLTGYQLVSPPDAPPLYNSDGTLNWAPTAPGLAGTWTNPVALLLGKYRANTSNLISNVSIGYTVVPGLELKTSAGFTNMQITENKTNPIAGTDPGKHITTGSAEFNSTNVQSWKLEPQVDYTVRLGKGVLLAMAGASFRENKSRVQYLNGQGFVNDALLENIQAAGSIALISAQASQYKYQAITGRINYNWDQKYIINLIARRDGSSRFGPGKQFGNFASVGSAWIFSNEKFVQENLPFLSFGKIRGSYGTTGNDQIGDYRFLDLYSATFASYLTYSGLNPTGLYNPDLAWETTKKLEGGIELGFLKDRITLQASFYQNRSGNQLVQTPVSLVTGYPSIAANLPATVQNTGLEFELRTVNIKLKNFSWRSVFNITIPQNKLLAFPGLASSTYANTYVVGQPVTITKIYHLIGVNDTTGLYQFTDAKGNPTYTPSATTDMTAFVNTAPKFYGGFQNSVSYKGFSLDVFFQFVKQTGLSVFRSVSRQLGVMYNFPEVLLDHWQKPGDKATYQMASQNTSGAAANAFSLASRSELAYTDASFIRLKNLAVSWQIPDNWKRRIHAQDLRIYINTQNLLTITNYNGADPESQNISMPPRRVWTAGFQLTF